MLPAPVKGSSLTMIIDRNDFGRHYWQFTLGAAGFGNRTLYNLDDPGSVTPVARPGIAAPPAPIRR